MTDKVVVVQVGQLAVITNPATGHVITMGQLGPRGPIGPAGVGSLSLSDDPPVMNGTASPGTSEAASRGDHRHPTDTSRASASALTTLTGVVNGHTSQIATNIADIEQLQTDVSDVTAQVVTNTSAIAGKVDEAPEDGALYGRKDGAWAGIPDPGAGGGSTPSATMQWKADATSGDPGYGRFGTDTGVVSTATTLHISAHSKNAIDISGFLQNLRAGATVYAYELRNTVNWAIFDVTADAVDHSDYYTVAVTPRAAEGAEPGDYADIGAFFSFGSVGGGGGSVDWGDIGGTLSAQTDLQAVLDAKLDASEASAFGLTLIDDADAAAARTTLGLATVAATGDVDDLTGFPGGTTNFLRADGTFAAPPGGGGGSGDVVGPSSAVNNRVAFFDGTSGKLIKDSGLTLSGSNTGDQTSVSGNAGTATALATSRNIDGVAFNGTADITVIAPATHAATSKATPVDADEVPLVDSAASNVLKRLTWANLKATLKTYFDPLYSTQGKQAIAIMAAAIQPSIVAGCAPLAKIAGGSNQPDVISVDFDAITEEYAQFAIPMPKKWDEGTITARFRWSHAATATNFGVVWALQALAVGDGDAIGASYGSVQSVADTGGTTNSLYITAETSAITVAGSPSAGDMVFFRVSRLPSNASDTLAVDARLHGVDVFVTTDAGTDA